MRRRVRALAAVFAAVAVATLSARADDGPAAPAPGAPPQPAAPPKKAPHVTPAPFGSVWEDLAAARAASEKDGRAVILYFTFDG